MAAALEEGARGQFKQAAVAYERAAGKVAPGAEKAKWLWSSADRYLKAWAMLIDVHNPIKPLDDA